jgi:hypothetical protein
LSKTKIWMILKMMRQMLQVAFIRSSSRITLKTRINKKILRIRSKAKVISKKKKLQRSKNRFKMNPNLKKNLT